MKKIEAIIKPFKLSKVKEALQHSGIEPFKGKKNIGCVLGIGGGQKLYMAVMPVLFWSEVTRGSPGELADECQTRSYIIQYYM